ncbi:ferritin-like domain-containing protein [Microbacterium sp. STN6]|uniref:YciE/YciF ferroxidase family protein n=1 Tax=Microbacterium sp. STN6 TaxID=2995588 RepID=UPI002260B3C0|nr:ferritin-like domain-containing protein [Microbacterium sp. STN6]MCX7522050.1 ferritin-like domain-containing protein [Microbacterium sp. STN6]
MFEHFNTPQELFGYQLATTMTMENDSLDMLKELEGAAQADEIKKLFAHHQDETRQQIANLERIFELLDIEKNAEPSPTTKGLAKEGSSMIGKTDPKLVDSVALSAALGTEHYEMSVYESLITMAEAMGAAEVQELLQENLQQEQHTADELNAAAKKCAAKAIV